MFGTEVYNYHVMAHIQFARAFVLGYMSVAVGAAANSVEGSLTANGHIVPLRSIILEAGMGQVGLLLTEEALPAACGVYDAFILADAGQLRGMAVSIDKETRTVERAGINGLYHESLDGRLGTIGEPEVKIERFDDEVLKGSISLASGVFGDHTFSYNAAFQVDLVVSRPVMTAQVSGAGDSEAAQAFVKYYEAMMAGRIEEGKPYVIAENAERMTGEDAELFLEFFQEGHPRKATITSVKQEGDKAELTVEGEIEGCMGVEKGTAKVEMVRESGAWKVALESWEM